MLTSRRIQGYVLLCSASVCFSLMGVCVKTLGKGHGVEAALIRFTFGMTVILGAWALGLARIRPTNYRLLVVRGIMGGSAAYLFFRSIGHIGLAQGTVLSFTYPLFTALVAFVFLHERPRPGVWVAIASAFVGVYLVLWPQDWSSGPVVHKLLALLGGLMGGIAVATIRRLRSTESSYTILLSMCLFGSLIMAGPATLVLVTKKNVPLACVFLFVPLPLVGWWLGLPGVLVAYSLALPCLLGFTHFLRTRRVTDASSTSRA